MFNKIKALKDVRSQAKVIEKALEAVLSTGTSRGVEVTLNGKQEVQSIVIPPEMDRGEIAEHVKRAFNEAVKDLQKKVQQAMKDAGGMPDLSQFGL
ncbi:MAG: YbaB/EbfC family nucleoid-associated protein [Patescibacteria group bacterium]